MSDVLSQTQMRSMTLPQLLRWRANRTPHKVALRQKDMGIWHGISWLEYYTAARQVAAGLSSFGLKRGDRIAIASEGTPEWLFADLGSEMIGVEVVGIYPTNPSIELRYIVDHCQARVVICGDQEQTDKVLEARISAAGLPHMTHIVCVDTKGTRRYPSDAFSSFKDLLEAGRRKLEDDPDASAWLDRQIDAGHVDDVAVLIYTSGTTGPPKGAALTHGNLTFATCSFAAAVGLKADEYEGVCYLPLCHVAERSYSMVLQLVLGGIVNFAESIDTVAINIREIAPTFFLGVPRIWEKLQQSIMFGSEEQGNRWRSLFRIALRRGRILLDRRQAAGGDRSAVQRLEQAVWNWLLFRNLQRYVGLDRSKVRICGGASVSPETLRFFDILGLPIYQGYGLTESCGMAFVQRPTGDSRAGSCGLALDEVEWKFGDDNEILIKSPGVFRGYLFDEVATSATLSSDGWLSTGDIGAVDETGELAIVDRKKAIIITSGGKNISPSEIENALRDSPYIREAIVVGEGQKFLGGLIQIDLDTVGRWASERDISYSNYKSLATHKAVYELVDGIVRDVNTRFARVENVRRFVILDKELDHDDGELTATQKIRRSIIETRFSNELKTIYGERADSALRH